MIIYLTFILIQDFSISNLHILFLVICFRSFVYIHFTYKPFMSIVPTMLSIDTYSALILNSMMYEIPIRIPILHQSKITTNRFVWNIILHISYYVINYFMKKNNKIIMGHVGKNWYHYKLRLGLYSS